MKSNVFGRMLCATAIIVAGVWASTEKPMDTGTVGNDDGSYRHESIGAGV